MSAEQIKKIIGHHNDYQLLIQKGDTKFYHLSLMQINVFFPIKKQRKNCELFSSYSKKYCIM